ncbi:MAG: hypothetical protein PVS2B1_22570 [Candidatus Dormibacteraceae bacterium]
MRHVALIFMLIALAATASNAPGATDSVAVANLQHELIDAYIHHDASVLQRILSDDYVFTQDYGGLDTKADVLSSFAAGGDRKIISYVIRDSRVKVYGDAAVMTYAYRSVEAYKGRDDGGDFRVTRVFIRMNGSWRMVAGQETRIAPRRGDTSGSRRPRPVIGGPGLTAAKRPLAPVLLA